MSNGTCMICMESLDQGELINIECSFEKCRYAMHKSCNETLIDKSSRCIICRKPEPLFVNDGGADENTDANDFARLVLRSFTYPRIIPSGTIAYILSDSTGHEEGSTRAQFRIGCAEELNELNELKDSPMDRFLEDFKDDLFGTNGGILWSSDAWDLAPSGTWVIFPSIVQDQPSIVQDQPPIVQP